MESYADVIKKSKPIARDGDSYNMYHGLKARDNHWTSNEHGGVTVSRRQLPKARENNTDIQQDHAQQQRGGCSSFFSQCTQETSFSGFKYIGGVNSGSFRRIFWFIVVVGAGYGLIFQIYNSTDKFIQRETNTKVAYVTKDELDFPSVTICNINMFELGKLVGYYGGWYATFIRGVQEVRHLFPRAGLSDEVALDSMENYPGNQNLYDFIMNSAHLKQDMISVCQYNGIPCSPDNFTTTVTNYGVCFTFNSAENEEKLTVKTPGQIPGLSLILNAHEEESVAAPRENVGFKILVHPRNEIPNLEDFGIELLTGTHTPIQLNAIEMSSLPSPYGKCVAEHIVESNYYTGLYTENQCYLECETDYIVEQCGCRHFYMPGNASYCAPDELRNCLYFEKAIFAGNRTNLCECPDACQETIYKPTLSQSYFPSTGVAMAMVTAYDYTIPSIAFTAKVFETSSIQFSNMYLQLYNDVWSMLNKISNSQGVLLSDQFSNDTLEVLLEYAYTDVFAEIMFEIYGNLAEVMFIEKWYDGAFTSAYGSDMFWDQYSHIAERFIYAGVYKDRIATGLLESGAYTDDRNMEESFDEFIDSVWHEFDFEESYFQLYITIYNDMRDLLLETTEAVSQTSDLVTLATDWMRKNLVSLDIFYGDLKVETIRDQPAYELFQFVCDLGGALGLFFGASLLSFIETVDFWFTRDGGTKKETRNMQLRKNDIQPDIITIS